NAVELDPVAKSRAAVNGSGAAGHAGGGVESTVPAPPAAATLQPIAAPKEEAARAQSKPKLVRDSFTIPKAEYAVLEQLKQRAAHLIRPTKKSELLRAGLAALNVMPDDAFLAALERVPSLKTGRPKSS
ncbi:MAG: hypothetical protein ACJ8G7_19380, partial [Rhizobacter sp.]